MIDFGELFGGLRIFGVAPMGVFTFVILLALINGVVGWLKVRAVQETIREAARLGTPLDPAAIRELKGQASEGGEANRTLVGLILVAVAAALALFGFVVGAVSSDGQAFPILAAIGAFPGLIGVAFLIAARGEARRGTG